MNKQSEKGIKLCKDKELTLVHIDLLTCVKTMISIASTLAARHALPSSFVDVEEKFS